MKVSPRATEAILNLRLTFLEWSEMLISTLQYKIQEGATALGIPLPDSISTNNWSEQMKKISDRGTLARLKLGRILVRLFSASVNKNRRAFERALADLIDLGKMIT